MGLGGEQGAADSADEGAQSAVGEDGVAEGAQQQAAAAAPGVWIVGSSAEDAAQAFARGLGTGRRLA